jgi:hypothetical protein
MGLLDIFSADARKQKAFDKMRAKLVSKNMQHDDRMWCIQQLAEMDTEDATRALFRRWDMVSDKGREDIVEKEYLADILVDKGQSMLPYLREHNDRSLNITWPIQVLRRVVDPEQVVDELLRILSVEVGRVASFRPEKKLRSLQLLADYPDDPRLTAAVLPCISDFDPDVRFEAAQLLGQAGSADAREGLLAQLCSPDEDSERVRRALLQAIHDRGFEVVDRKDEIAPQLGDGWRIGPKGTLIIAD